MTEEVRTEALSQLIYKCAKEAFLELFKNKEHYYNCVLLALAEGYAPILSAWSYEALDREIPKHPKEEIWLYKWNFADSPYYAFGEEYFKPVQSLLDTYPSIFDMEDEDEIEREFELRVSAMVQAMQKLDQEGIFSINQPREQVYINVECIPNDNSDVDRALLLNEAKNIQEWLKDNPKVEE
nr:DUF4303 domain-containing protein [uncultured Capnocytophaga sp.]